MPSNLYGAELCVSRVPVLDTQVSNTMVRVMDTEDIDKQKYFDFYIKPFFKSIVKEFV